MPKPKDKDWLNGYKIKILIYAVYKRPTSKQGTHRLKVKGWKKIFHTNRDQKKTGVAIVMFGNACTPVGDSCQCKAKPIQYCKVK